MDKWDGPFGVKVVRGFLAHMREGDTAELFRTREAPSGEEAELLGWFQRERYGPFVGLTAAGSIVSGAGLRLSEAVAAFLELDPDWVLHNVAWKPKKRIGTAGEITPALREAIREVIEDPRSGGSEWLERRKREYWMGSRYPWGLAISALSDLGYSDTPEEVAKEFASNVEEAFEVFKQRRPDLNLGDDHERRPLQRAGEW